MKQKQHVAIGSMYGIFTYIFHEDQANVGKSTRRVGLTGDTRA